MIDKPHQIHNAPEKNPQAGRKNSSKAIQQPQMRGECRKISKFATRRLCL
jgi:hypothetical protein